MTLPAPTYDLVLLLDPQAEPDARAKIIDGARQAIAAKGEVVNDADWGDRALAYPIVRKKDAEYRLLQFKASTPELLDELDRTLRITDGVLRFRIVKLKPGTPAPPDLRSGAHAYARTASESASTAAAGTSQPTAAADPTPADADASADADPVADQAAAGSSAPAPEEPAGEPAEQATLAEPA
jgi:small subunit ribosomal protein S6